MDKKESLKLLDRYTDALNLKAEAEDRIDKVEAKYRVNTEAFNVPFAKVFFPFLGVFEFIAFAFRFAISSSLTYQNEVPVTIGMAVGAALLALGFGKLAHLFAVKKAKAKMSEQAVQVQKLRINEVKDANADHSKATYRIAEIESALPVACRGLEAAKSAKNKLYSGKVQTLEEAVGGFTDADWEEAYTANPKFYGKPGSEPFGALALTEVTRTVLPKDPKSRFTNEGSKVSDWKLVLVSLTTEEVVGDCDYYDALAKLDGYVLDSNEDSILVRGLNQRELAALLKK
ncbi:MAG: DUF4299 family protein [Clostridiales bacterium]|nr:DUF4299 family protein [Clostridiales bacterium]